MLTESVTHALVNSVLAETVLLGNTGGMPTTAPLLYRCNVKPLGSVFLSKLELKRTRIGGECGQADQRISFLVPEKVIHRGESSLLISKGLVQIRLGFRLSFLFSSVAD